MVMVMEQSNKRVILLMGGVTYRGAAFVAAAERLGLEVVRGLDMPRPLSRHWCPTLPLDFRDPDRAVRDLVAYARAHPAGAILGFHAQTADFLTRSLWAAHGTEREA